MAGRQGARWEHFSHGADIGVRGIGGSRAQAFEQAALALTHVVVEPERVAARERVDIECEAPDDDFLLLEWLNSLIYEMATRGMLFARYTVQIEGRQLRAHALGEKVDVARHQPAVEVKGATLTELRVTEDPPGVWIAQCVVDV